MQLPMGAYVFHKKFSIYEVFLLLIHETGSLFMKKPQQKLRFSKSRILCLVFKYSYYRFFPGMRVIAGNMVMAIR